MSTESFTRISFLTKDSYDFTAHNTKVDTDADFDFVIIRIGLTRLNVLKR